MSEEQLKAFIAKVQGDKSLQDQLNAEGADPVVIAKGAGFSITTEDLGKNLSEEELEGVAGGTAGMGHPGMMGLGTALASFMDNNSTICPGCK